MEKQQKKVNCAFCLMLVYIPHPRDKDVFTARASLISRVLFLLLPIFQTILSVFPMNIKRLQSNRKRRRSHEQPLFRDCGTACIWRGQQRNFVSGNEKVIHSHKNVMQCERKSLFMYQRIKQALNFSDPVFLQV